MRFIYSYLDVFCTYLLKKIDRVHPLLQVVLTAVIMTPILIAAGLADWLGKKSDDVL